MDESHRDAPAPTPLEACFLGPYGENDTLLEKLVVEFLRDHVYWRRNFHPEDPPAIPTRAAQTREFLAFEASLRRELHALSARLKRSVPFHSPRYMGHMVSDLLIPAIAAQVLTLPYNPNNVTAGAAPVTVELELRAGLQLARMLGFPDDPAQADCAFGHLTSGGTVANFQALRLALALKAFPVALRAIGAPGVELPADDWAAFNLTPTRATALLAAWQHALAGMPPRMRRDWSRRLDAERIETLGLVEFLARHRQLSPPRVLAPASAHYSWSKGMKLLGLGREQLELVPGRDMRMDVEALDDALVRAEAARAPVLMIVAVLGSTELGTIDPLDRIADVRDQAAARGFGCALHVDAAWGGYLATLFRDGSGALRPLEAVRAGFAAFPSRAVHSAFSALPRADTVTVDPHKLGHVPYGAGAFVCRDQRAMALLDEPADYVFCADPGSGYFERHADLGRYTPEGSRPGAAAAAVYVTHRVVPLDHEHFGRILGEGIRAAEAFRGAAHAFARRVADVARVLVPFEPDTNLVCLALNPSGNRDVAAMNAYVRALHARLDADAHSPVQAREFYGSTTTIRAGLLGAGATRTLLDEIGVDPATLDPGSERADHIVVLRHTLMNPFLIDGENGISYIDGYFEFLERELRALAARAPAPRVEAAA
ncbi:MAG TPA: pyridoxal-dependent decarboxylase [Xanthomonadales bacterium]|nr:pyridoxal-dependent decarboxylase [Xanthomonadales bacterium]